MNNLKSLTTLNRNSVNVLDEYTKLKEMHKLEKKRYENEQFRYMSKPNKFSLESDEFKYDLEESNNK